MSDAPHLFVSDVDFQLYCGDALQVLRQLPDESVHCCVTSPPYWGLRDYGSDGQIGLEATPDEYVATMVAVFREVRRVLRDDGTLWLNLGSSYATGTDGFKPKDMVPIPWMVAMALQADGWYLRSDIIWAKPNPMPESVTDRPTKSHEYVFMLTKSARYFFDAEAVRESYSVTSHGSPRVNPGTKADAGGSTTNGQGATSLGFFRPAVVAPQAETLDGSEGEAPRGPDGRRTTTVEGRDGSLQHRDGERWPNGGRNIRTVWDIATQPYAEAHFATFPLELPRRCIAAGCPEQVCGTCGAPRERITEHGAVTSTGGSATGARATNMASVSPLGQDPHSGAYNTGAFVAREKLTTGWSDCGHDNYQPGVVLDPFAGSGTANLVARNLGRHSIGIELSPSYCELAAKRLAQQSLLAS